MIKAFGLGLGILALVEYGTKVWAARKECERAATLPLEEYKDAWVDPALAHALQRSPLLAGMVEQYVDGVELKRYATICGAKLQDEDEE